MERFEDICWCSSRDSWEDRVVPSLAVRQFQVNRARHAPGFYKALHGWSTADLLDSTIGNADSLPKGCYRLDRVVSKRAKQVINK